MTRGESLLRLNHPDFGQIGVLICFDLSHHQIVHRLNTSGDDPCEVMVVVSYNPYSELYRACAIADAHRYYQYVLLCNVKDYGGTGIYAPKIGRGPRMVVAEAGTGVSVFVEAELDIAGLRGARAGRAGGWRRRAGMFYRRLQMKP
jgi:predicted amidohydrolase